MPKRIFVFGSNLAGIHGAGAALEAVTKHGAVKGRASGLQGASYGIPTKNQFLRTLPLSVVRSHIIHFMNFADRHPEFEFQVTQIGCGLAGFTAEEIAPIFGGAPDNCLFDEAWKPYLGKRKYWGTFK